LGILFSIGIGTAVFAFGFADIDLLLPCILILMLGAGWIYAQWVGMEWSSMAGLIGAGIIGGSGILIGANSAWMLAGILFSLLAWDLIEFQTRLSFAASVSDPKLLERKHLRLLGMLAVSTAALYLITIFVHLKLGVWWLIFLAFVLTFGLIQLLWKLK
jgi:hypothetical protein